MTSPSTPTSTTSAPAASAFHGPPKAKPFVRYVDRMELAREAAKTGLGHEDLVVRFHILPRDAWKIVFGR